MSAESCSMSICVDRHLYGRLVLDRLLYGNRPLDEDWRLSMGLDGGVVTDAKSLYDHLNTTGQSPRSVRPCWTCLLHDITWKLERICCFGSLLIDSTPTA